MSHYLPAPYEAAPDDDLAAAIGATLAITFALLTAWIVGVAAYDRIRQSIQWIQQGLDPDESFFQLVGTGLGWGFAVIFLFFGAISLLRRRARGAVMFGALLSIATTFLAENQFKSLVGEPHVWMFYGGVAVLIAALLPATKRWLKMPAAAAPVMLAAPPPKRIGQIQR